MDAPGHGVTQLQVPRTRRAWCVLFVPGLAAVVAAAVGVVLKLVERSDAASFTDFMHSWKCQKQSYDCFQEILGFFLIFRTSHGYARYAEASQLLHELQGSFFDACSSILAFSAMSKADSHQISEFKRWIATLFSLLHAVALHSLEVGSDGAGMWLEDLNVLCADALSEEHVKTIVTSNHKVALLFHWIESALIQSINSGVLNAPPPMISGAFLKLSVGMLKYEDCLKLIFVRFPAPYTCAAFVCLVFHWLLTPFHLCSLCQQPSMVALYTFITVFAFWSMFKLAQHMEHPFGEDDMALDTSAYQHKLNVGLLVLLSPHGSHRPRLLPEHARRSAAQPLLGSLATVLQGSPELQGDWQAVHQDRADEHTPMLPAPLASLGK